MITVEKVHESEGKIVFDVKFASPKSPLDLLCYATIVDCGNYLRVCNLYTPLGYRKMGFATYIMEWIFKNFPLDTYVEADTYEIDSNHSGMSDKQLREWYLSLGFEFIPNHPFSMVKRKLLN